MEMANDIYNMLKELIGLAKKMKQQPMIELAMDIQAKLFELKDENQRLKQENTELKDKKALEADIVRHEEGYLTRKSEDGLNLKYCAVCWAKHGKLVPLRTVKHKAGDGYYCTDLSCKAHFGKEPKITIK